MKLKILLMEWKSYGNEDIEDAARGLSKEGYDIVVDKYPFDNHISDDDKEFQKKLSEHLRKDTPDFVFSFNFFPVVSKACNEAGVKYVAWVYDNPAVRLFSYTLINSCNYVFVFDSQVYETFALQGFKNVYYLPLAAAVHRYDVLANNGAYNPKFAGDISFVGQLYHEDHTYYDDMIDKVSDYTRGYLEGLMKAQMEIQGMSIVEKALNPRVMSDMVDALGIKPSYDSVETYEYLYSNYVIDRKITSIERSEIIAEIGLRRGIDLYTKDGSFAGEGIRNHGKIDYYLDMPFVFMNSRINLNITLRSIQRGIPLRAWDIMGCGGFLLTNYQEDFNMFFDAGTDYVYYEDRRDLLEKVDYYLEHDEERMAIALNGYKKVAAHHTYEHRLKEMIDIVM